MQTTQLEPVGPRGHQKGRILPGLLATALCWAAPGCGGGGTPDMGQAGDLNVGMVTFTQIQTQVFLPHCGPGGVFGMRSCHAKMPYEDNLGLVAGTAYDDLVNKPSVTDRSTLRVKAADPDNSLLYLKLANKQGPARGNPMPYVNGGQYYPIAPELIAMVYAWIQQGAQNN